MAKQYDDMGKDAKDLLEKGFPNSGTFKITTETKTPNGVSLNASATRSVKVKKEKATESIVALVEPKFDWKEHNVELSAKLATDNKFEGEIAFKDLGTKGAKLSVKGAQDPENGLSTTESFTFKNDNVAAKVGFTYPFAPQKPIRAVLSGVVRYEKFLFGVDVAYDTKFQKEDDNGKVTEVDVSTSVNAQVGVVGDGWEGVVGLKNFPTVREEIKKDLPRDSVYFLSFYHKVSEWVKYALNFSLDHSQTNGPAAVFGGEYKFDDSTTLKGKVSVKNAESSKPGESNPEFRVGLGVAQKVSANATTTFGADLNLRKLLGTNVGADPSFGFDLKLS